MNTVSQSWTPIIGMEIHVELKTASKMFCACANDPFHAEKPNTYTCPVCLGLPGALPVANKKAIEYTIKLGLALGCRINQFSKFDRKHYFYPDLPKGYQISQYDIPFCVNGVVHTSEGDVRIRRVHLEEDTGKLMHQTVHGDEITLIDFNRSGVPLVEIVTEPDIHSATQAKEYCKKLRQIVRYLGISECDMEQGGMRLEANISVKKAAHAKRLTQSADDELPNYKVELKNINSFRFLERGIVYDIKRQIAILEQGETPVQETRGYSAQNDATFTQRVKETAEDYRYFPDPDIPPIAIDDAWLAAIAQDIPELPDAVFARWRDAYGVKPDYSELLCETPEHAAWFEELFAELAQRALPADACMSALANKRIAVRVFEDSYEAICDALGRMLHAEEIPEEELSRVLRAVLAEQPKAVAEYRSGKEQALQFLVGQVLKKLGKKINVADLASRIKQELKETS